MQLKDGSNLQSGKYRIICVLGQGGFGITYLAENIYLGKMFAIKEFFPKDFCGRDNTSHLTLGTQNNTETVAKLKARFLKEAKNIAHLDHPGIIKIHDIFEENNTAYYVMDYIDGENLNEMVKRNGPLSEDRAVNYIRKVGDALDYIHSRNMTHFDVKPANIVVRRSDDMPILIDFGLSKQYDAHGDATSTLMQGVSHGYSPIELYNPGTLSSFSPQTDVYSLAATLYYLLTATVPPAASEILENGITIPPSISDSNSSAIKAALSIPRSKRPQHITSFTEQLSIKSKNNNLNPQLSLNSHQETIFIDLKTQQSNLETQSNLNSKQNLRLRKKSKKKLYLSVCMVIGIVITIIFTIYHTGSSKDILNTALSDSLSLTNNSMVDNVDSMAYTKHNIEQATKVKDMFWDSQLGIASYTGEVIINANNGDKIPNGKGVAKISEGQYKGCEYHGEFANGKMEGEAVYTQTNGDIFQGYFKNNKYAHGRYIIKSSGEYFEGTYDNNGQPFYGDWYDRNGNKL